MDPCGVYSICIVYGVLGLDVCGVTAFVAFMGRWRCTLNTLGSCLAFVCFFMLRIGGCLRVWRIGAQASPSHEPLPPSLAFSSQVPSAWREGSWLEGAGLPAIGA